MHFSDLGMIAQMLALVFTLYAIASSVLGAALKRPALVVSGRRSVLVVAALLVTAAIALIASFLEHDYGLRYVAEHSSNAMPWYYTAAAFYGGQEGSLLYWGMMLALFSIAGCCALPPRTSAADALGRHCIDGYRGFSARSCSTSSPRHLTGSPSCRWMARG